MLPFLTALSMLVPLVLVGGAVWTYNRLVTSRNRYRNLFSQIDVQLKRRYDLIPSLVEVAKRSMDHEREVLEEIGRARAAAASASAQAAAAPGAAAAMAGIVAAETALVGAMGSFLAVVERYPDLKADRSLRTLMEELTSTENRIGFARQAYNDAVMRYNTARETFPGVLLAGPLGLGEAAYFRIDDSREREALRIALDA